MLERASAIPLRHPVDGVPRCSEFSKHEIDPTFVISHRMKLDEAPPGYDMFMKENNCTKLVLTLQIREDDG